MACTEGRNTAEIMDRGNTLVIPVAAETVIYEGCLVVIDENGYAIPAKKAEGLTAAGRAEEFIDNTRGGNGDKTVIVKRGVFKWDNSGIEAEAVNDSHLLQNCYIEDDCTVTSVSTGTSVAGKVVGVYEDGIAVETI